MSESGLSGGKGEKLGECAFIVSERTALQSISNLYIYPHLVPVITHSHLHNTKKQLQNNKQHNAYAATRTRKFRWSESTTGALWWPITTRTPFARLASH